MCEVGRQVEFTLENLVNCFLSVLPSERRLESTIEKGGKTGLVQIFNLCTQNSLQSFRKQVKLLQIGWIKAAHVCSQTWELDFGSFLLAVCIYIIYGIYIIYIRHAAELGYREAEKLQRENHAIITVHLLLQSACHTLMPPNSTSPQHGYAHSSSRFQGPYKQKNQKYKSVLMRLILIVAASFQTKPHLSSQVVLSDWTYEPPVKKGKPQALPPEQSNILYFMVQLTCIQLFHRMCVWLFHREWILYITRSQSVLRDLKLNRSDLRLVRILPFVEVTLRKIRNF